MKLNDNEIIKAIECCKGGDSCPDERPFYSADFKHSCIDDDGIMEQAYDLLIRQRDENARLRGVIKILEADVKAAKSEAYKEFAERLKEIICKENDLYIRCAKNLLSEDFQRGYEEKNDNVIGYIDHILKELTERKEDEGK